MIYGIFVFFHIIACLVLIAVILLQSGRGGGLSEMAGGGVQQTQKLFGTQTNSLLMKFTSYCAIAFIITSITLVFLTSRKSRSLMEGARIQPIFNTETPAGSVKPADKKTLEEAVKALAEAAKKNQTEAGKAVDAAKAEGAKLVETAKEAAAPPAPAPAAAPKQ